MSHSFVYIEDDVLSRQIAQILFSRVLGYPNLTLYENSTDIVKRLDSLPQRPAAIFVDIQIGPQDGYEVLKMLRSHPDYRTATVIAMTANVMSHDVEKLREAGFSGLIGKPIMQDVFPELVTKILAGEQVWYVP